MLNVEHKYTAFLNTTDYTSKLCTLASLTRIAMHAGIDINMYRQ